MLTYNIVHRLFILKDDGFLRYKNPTNNLQKKEILGFKHPHCRGRNITINKHIYRLVIISYLFHTGVLLRASDNVIFKNGNYDDYRFKNLDIITKKYRENKELSQEYLRRLFNYDKAKGCLTRKSHNTKNNRGISNNKNYVNMVINSKIFWAHTLVWIYHNGFYDNLGFRIEHINQLLHDNKIENLRLITFAQNAKNRVLGKNNKTGHVGIDVTKQGKYRARISVNNKNIFLGLFNTLKEATKVREDANKKSNKQQK